MKRSWYSEMVKTAKANDMYLQDAIAIHRQDAGLRMLRRVSKPHKVFKGEPQELCFGVVTVKVFSKRTRKLLYTEMELVEDLK